jgi:hypothetical protein
MEALGVDEIPEVIPVEEVIEPLPAAARTSSRRPGCRENTRPIQLYGWDARTIGSSFFHQHLRHSADGVPRCGAKRP